MWKDHHGSFQKLANIKACKDITLKYGYHLAQNKANVNRHRLIGADKAKYEINDVVKASLKDFGNWPQLIDALKSSGIETHFKYLSGTDQIQGISFSKDNYKFKGSEIDRSLSYGKICAHLQSNEQRNVFHNEVEVNGDKFSINNSVYDHTPTLLETLLANQQKENMEAPFELRKRKRKLKKGDRL